MPKTFSLETSGHAEGPRILSRCGEKFQTCVPQGCSAVLLVGDDLKQDLQKSDKGTITVYAPNGQAVQAPTQLRLRRWARRAGQAPHQALTGALPTRRLSFMRHPFPLMAGPAGGGGGRRANKTDEAHGEGKAKPAGAKPSHVTTAPWLNSWR
jgi:hypothetical protein